MIVRSVGWAVAGLAALAAVGIASTRPLAYDLGSQTDAARRLLAGETLYPLADRVPMYLGPGDYIWHPTTAIVFIPIALLPADVARSLWTLGIVALAALLGYALIRPLPEGVRPWTAAGYVLFLPLIAEITLGNLDLVALALGLLAWHLRERPVPAGAALALAVGLKPLPILLPLFFLAAGARRVVLWATAMGGVALVATLPLLLDEWRTYLGLAAQIAAAPAASYVPIAPNAVELRLFYLAGALAVTIGMGAVARVAPPGSPARERLALATALAAVPLAAPTIAYPYLVFALPLLAALVRAPAPAWVLGAATLGWLAMEVPPRSSAPIVAFGGLLLLISLGAAVATRRPHPDRTAERPATAAR